MLNPCVYVDCGKGYGKRIIKSFYETYEDCIQHYDAPWDCIPNRNSTRFEIVVDCRIERGKNPREQKA